jgi:hypothetical protein
MSSFVSVTTTILDQSGTRFHGGCGHVACRHSDLPSEVAIRISCHKNNASAAQPERPVTKRWVRSPTPISDL